MNAGPGPVERRLLFVHAHPDDETITTGATMAKCVAEGGWVTLVTCTRGEEGEILLPDLAHLAADQQDGLGAYREQELAAAMAELGVTDHRFLGHPGKYRDSGMQGLASNEDPRSFWQADLRAAATDLVAVLREVRPHALVTYDDNGGYGHPDHVQAHRVATYALALAAVASYRPDLGAAWDVPDVFWVALPRSVAEAGAAAVAADSGRSGFTASDPTNAPYVVDDALVTTSVAADDYLPAKRAALGAHATQVLLSGDFYALSNRIGNPVLGHEYYRHVRGSGGLS